MSQVQSATDGGFARLTDGSLARCYSLAGYLLGNALDAQDATQEAMARAWRGRDGLADESAFESWLDRIVVNVCLDRLRRRRLVRFLPIDTTGAIAVSDPFQEFLTHDQVGRALEILTPEQRVVVVLRFWRDLTVDEIATRLACPQGTVKSRLHKAILRLRAELARETQSR